MATAAVPVPVSVIDWGLPGALSAMLIDAVRPKMAAGVKVTVMVQVPLAAIAPVQLLLCAKSPGLVPVKEIPVMLKLALPVLVTMTLWEALVVPSV